jgi:hypothetical protein
LMARGELRVISLKRRGDFCFQRAPAKENSWLFLESFTHGSLLKPWTCLLEKFG